MHLVSFIFNLDNSSFIGKPYRKHLKDYLYVLLLYASFCNLMSFYNYYLLFVDIIANYYINLVGDYDKTMISLFRL